MRILRSKPRTPQLVEERRTVTSASVEAFGFSLDRVAGGEATFDDPHLELAAVEQFPVLSAGAGPTPGSAGPSVTDVPHAAGRVDVFVDVVEAGVAAGFRAPDLRPAVGVVSVLMSMDRPTTEAAGTALP